MLIVLDCYSTQYVLLLVVVSGGQNRLAASAWSAPVQRRAGRYPYLPTRLSQPHYLPGIQTALRAANTKCHSERIHGWQEGLPENGQLFSVNWRDCVFVLTQFAAVDGTLHYHAHDYLLKLLWLCKLLTSKNVMLCYECFFFAFAFVYCFYVLFFYCVSYFQLPCVY